MIRRMTLVLILCAVLIPLSVYAGQLDPGTDPSVGSGMPTTTDIYNRLDTGADILAPGAFSEPVAGPTAGTGKSLSDIQAKLPVPDNTSGATTIDVHAGKTFWGLRTDGTWGPQIGSNANVVNTGSGDAAASEIVCGKKAWVKGAEVAGALCPDQNTECVSRACISYACVSSYMAAGTVCNQNGGRICDGSGSCVTCITASDCPGTGNQCATPVCTSNSCEIAFLPSFTQCNQNGGVVCDGAGNCN
ncbi:MAG: hypothetical protein WA610_09345 [Thermodesulfovibrionales bacterium]